jgi:hypothetical protein
MGFVTFMSSTAGRWTRGLAGAALIALGGLLGGAWWIATGVGVVLVAVGVFDVCLFAPLFKQPLSGKAIRVKKG